MIDKAHILVIEDDETIRNVLKMTLSLAGCAHIQTASRGDEGLVIAKNGDFDLILLDLMLPGLDGLSICRTLRRRKSPPIIVLTAKTADEDVVQLLDAGADDYITKPFSRQVLLSRICAVLRRTRGIPHKELAGLALDEEALEARLGGELVPLTKSEFLTLAALATHPGRTLSRTQLARKAGADDFEASGEEAGRAVDVRISVLRKKLGAWAVHLQTIRGAGYRVGL